MMHTHPLMLAACQTREQGSPDEAAQNPEKRDHDPGLRPDGLQPGYV